MSKITLTDLVNLQNETTAVNAINTNNAALRTASDNTLSRDGTSPNQMTAAIDMNNNQIYNLPAPSTVNAPARLIDVTSNPTIVVPGTGTSGHTVPFLDGNNTWSGTNTLSTVHVTGTSALDGVTTFTATPVFPSNSIANASLATMAVNTAKGSIAGGTPADLTKTQLTTLINPFSSTLSGAAPLSGGGTANFLRADGTWALPAIGGSITSSLGADVLLNNISTYFDGPSIAQGSAGTWWVTGTVTFLDTANACQIRCKLWDGTTVIASSVVSTTGANGLGSVTLSGFLASPAGNLRISCKDISFTTGKIIFNSTGESKDSTISAIRIA